jgi:hypothetical protein
MGARREKKTTEGPTQKQDQGAQKQNDRGQPNQNQKNPQEQNEALERPAPKTTNQKKERKPRNQRTEQK